MRVARQSAVSAALGLAAVVVVAVHPGPLLSLFPRLVFVVDHLPSRTLDRGDPNYFHAGSRKAAIVNTAAIRRAGELVPDAAVYYIRRPASDPSGFDVSLAAQLFLLPAVQSRSQEDAAWILSYRLPGTRDPGQHAVVLAADLELTQVDDE